MKFTLESERNVNLISASEPGEIRLRDRMINSSVVITRSQVLSDWPPGHVDEIEQRHFETVVNLGPEVILLGTGPAISFPSAELLAWVALQGVGLEVMDTAAACRTFNVLVLEGRSVAAALILPRTATGDSP